MTWVVSVDDGSLGYIRGPVDAHDDHTDSTGLAVRDGARPGARRVGVLMLALGVALIVLLPDNTTWETIGALCITAGFACFCLAGCWGGCCGGWNGGWNNHTHVEVHNHGPSQALLGGVGFGNGLILATHRDGMGGWVYRDET
jgi:hypothetical protein